MKYQNRFRKLGRGTARRWLFVVVLVAITHLLFQSFLFPYGKALLSLLPESEVAKDVEFNLWTVRSSTKSAMVRNPLTVNISELADTSTSVGLEEDVGNFNVGQELGSGSEGNGNEAFEDVSLKVEQNSLSSTLQDVRDSFVDDSFPLENARNRKEILMLASIKSKDNDSSINKAVKDGQDFGSSNIKANNERQDFVLEQFTEPNIKLFKDNVLAENISMMRGKSDGVLDTPLQPSQVASSAAASNNATFLTTSTSSKSSSLAQLGDPPTSETNSSTASISGLKKMSCDMPPKTITTFAEMNNILVRHRAKSRSMRPRWSSARDQDILAAKAQIEHATPAVNDRELYAPLFRNISMFKKSYELMERTLKVYVYKEGEKPIFHQPILKGLYASEGWFMKLMEGNRRFAVKDPRRAHLFYMPFSSRVLEHVLYVRNSHNRTNLRQYLRDYSEKIAAKYSYWNRTGGADHFLVACHDWAPYETRHHMERCMKALCNADVTTGFKIGRDVSLPETYVRSARNPLRDLGGKPPSQRHILAFYAGNLHGYLRPILLEHWKDKDPNMKIFGPMPPGVASKMNYIQHMKSSKYCICPKGYEVNSPRVVEAIFYECVPVIISDNFVPPFFEVLNWEAFSIVLAEKDIPNLKDILLSIPKEKYLAMQLAVRKAQKHFLWHAKPLKYDLFHMTLHSIWYNRVFQIKPR